MIFLHNQKEMCSIDKEFLVQGSIIFLGAIITTQPATFHIELLI